jgi:hypothetical protein
LNKLHIIAEIEPAQTTIQGAGIREKRKQLPLVTIHSEDERMGIAILAAVAATCPDNFKVGLWQKDDNGILTELKSRGGLEASQIGRQRTGGEGELQTP